MKAPAMPTFSGGPSPVLSRFVGYRAEPPKPAPTYALYIWPFIGAFGGIALLQAIFTYSSYFSGRHVPPIIASFGASAILCYGSIDVPLAQPRALVGGHLLSAFIGICIARIFSLSFGNDSVPSTQWAAGALAVAVALVAMQATRTTHPPAGATALLPCVDQAVWALQWYYLPVILLSVTIVLVTALLINNIQRQYPKFWIAPRPPPSSGVPGGQQLPLASTDRLNSEQTLAGVEDPEAGRMSAGSRSSPQPYQTV